MTQSFQSFGRYAVSMLAALVVAAAMVGAAVPVTPIV